MRQVRVVKVVDGDTVHVRDIGAPDTTPVEKVRLQGIDAPEVKMEYGPEATAALNGLLFPNQNVYLEAAAKPDKYGRTLGRLWTIHHDLAQVPSNRVDVNLAMVKGGHAWVYREFPFPDGYDEAEKYAKEHASSPGGTSNLWANKDAEPPWSWRHRHKPACRNCGKNKARYRVRHRNIGEAIPVCSQACAQMDCLSISGPFGKHGRCGTSFPRHWRLEFTMSGGIAGMRVRVDVYADGRVMVGHAGGGPLQPGKPVGAPHALYVEMVRSDPNYHAPNDPDRLHYYVACYNDPSDIQLKHIGIRFEPKELAGWPAIVQSRWEEFINSK